MKVWLIAVYLGTAKLRFSSADRMEASVLINFTLLVCNNCGFEKTSFAFSARLFHFSAIFCKDISNVDFKT